MTTAPKDDGKWHLDKKVPLALIFALIMQSFILVAGGASLYTRVDQVERTVAAQGAAIAPITEKVIRVDAKMDGVKDDLTEIKLSLRNPPRR